VRLNPDTIIDLFPKKMWQKKGDMGQGWHNLNHLCLAMSQNAWDALVLRLKENTISLEDGPVPRWGAHGTGISVYFRDPESNLIEARYYEQSSAAADAVLES
jgi:extradiol dioxygenase family protein